MKQLNILLAFFFLVVSSGYATHDNWYFAWHQDEYVQGSWKRSGLLGRRNPLYLRPVLYADLMGTVPLEMPLMILQHLSEQKPDYYGWKCEMEIAGDTLLVTTTESIPDFQLVKNEVTLSVVMQNGFNYVTFIRPEGRRTYGEADIDIPWFDLRKPPTGFAPQKRTEEKDTAWKEENRDTLQSEEGELPKDSVEKGKDSVKTMEGDRGEEQTGISFWLTIGLLVVAAGIGFGLGKIRSSA